MKYGGTLLDGGGDGIRALVPKLCLGTHRPKLCFARASQRVLTPPPNCLPPEAELRKGAFPRRPWERDLFPCETIMF